MWKTLKEILKGNKNAVEYKEIQCGNKLISNPEEIAEEFNSYLVDSVRQLRSKFIEEYIEKVKFSESKFDEFKEINEENLYSIVRKLANKAVTEEGITVEIMKTVVQAVGDKIWCIINKSLKEGIFPRNWKETIIIPVPKIRGTKKIEEFRPINKLPVYEKILETVVQRQMVLLRKK